MDFEVRFTIDSTFSNRSDYVGVVTPSVTMGFLDVRGVPLSGGQQFRTSLGPIIDVSLPVDIGADDAGVPNPWPSGETGMFPLGGFNDIVLRGSIDLSN